MAPNPRMSPPKNSNQVLMSRGLAVVLRSCPKQSKLQPKRKDSIQDQPCKGCEEITEYGFGPEVFENWTQENGECYWNPCLVQSVKSLEYKGFVRPTTLLVGGTDYSLEVVRSAWGRRMLRPPHGYEIVMLGDLDPVSMKLIAQTQFAPLPEALCKVVYDLTSENATVSLQVISKRLKTTFPELMVPSEDILYRTLGTLIKERKLYHTGSGYSVVTPDTFRLLAMSPPLERQMLLTNEEAIVRLHGAAYTVDNGRTTCTQTQQHEVLTAWSSAERIMEPRKQGMPLGKLKRCHSLKLLRSRDKEKLSRSNSFKSSGASPGPNHELKSDNDNADTIKKEKPSMFSRWFRRGRSEKSKPKAETTSSTQFPPKDWSDPDYALFNSRATQTLERNEEICRTKVRSSSLNRTTSKERHSHHLSSIPATPRICHRNGNRHQRSEINHPRSSSLTRRTSPSPKRDVQNLTSKNYHHHFDASNNVEEENRARPRFESPFTSFNTKIKTQPLLLASEKYNDVQYEIPSRFNGKISPYHSTDIIKPQAINSNLNSIPLERNGWRRPISFQSTFYKPTIGIDQTSNSLSPGIAPRFTSTPKTLSSMPPNKDPTTTPKVTTKTIVSEIKSSETITKTIPNGTKAMTLGTTVDVEISLRNPQSKQTIMNTDLDNPSKNDLFKIATTWNQSINSNKLADSEIKPKLTTTTNIKTSLSHEIRKDGQRTVSTKAEAPVTCPTISTSDYGRETLDSISPRSTLASDAKSEFFSESPNTTTEVHLSKDDSGFSSSASASTSRPMSVSPC